MVSCQANVQLWESDLPQPAGPNKDHWAELFFLLQNICRIEGVGRNVCQSVPRTNEEDASQKQGLNTVINRLSERLQQVSL